MKKTIGRDELIAAGVLNLRASYPQCDEKNILTDYIYASFFKRMLKESLGKIPASDPAIRLLLDEVEKATSKPEEVRAPNRKKAVSRK